MKKVIVLFGKPGAGKGTRLSEFLKGREDQFEVLSVGNLLRKARKEQTELGKKAEAYMNAGKLVPDEIINSIAIDGIQKAEKTVITDGFPRTVAQAEAMIEAGAKPDVVIHFYVDDEVVLERAKHRIVCGKCGETFTTNEFKRPKQEGVCDKCGGELLRRADDNEDVVRNRLEVYAAETYPVLEVFEKANVRIYTIDNDSRDSGEEFAKTLTEH